MILTRDVEVKPKWWESCELITISKLLEVLSNTNVWHISVHYWRGVAFIIIKYIDGKKGEFYYLSQKFWKDVSHIISTAPIPCSCWRCEWRMKRRRYCNPQDFNHVFKS